MVACCLMLRNKNVHGLPGWSVGVRGGRGECGRAAPLHTGRPQAARIPQCGVCTRSRMPQYYYTGVSVCEQAPQVIQVYSESVCSSLFYCITLGLPSCAAGEDTRWLTFKGLPCLPSSPLCRRQPRGTTKTPLAADAFSPVDSDMPASY